MKKRKVDYGLLFYREVFGLDYLHFGLWREGDELTVENLKKAQERYFEKLISLIPENVRTILDVGCGTGVSTEILIKKGYEVEGLSPDKYQMQEFHKRLGNDVRFNLCKFEDFIPQKRYDLVLMSESSQYINIDKLFCKTRECLNKNCYLLVADYFRKTDTKYYRTCHILGNFLHKAEQEKFRMLYSEDITGNVLKTLDFGMMIFKEYCNPVINIISTYLENEYSLFVKILKAIFRRKIKKLNYYLRIKTPEKLDSIRFMDELVYKILLFKNR